MNIVEAIHDPNVFRPFLSGSRDGSLRTWRHWLALLRAIYGLPIHKKQRPTFREVTGRKVRKLPPDGFNTVLALTGRRSGKSRIAATIAAYEALLGNHQSRLAPGEVGYVPVISPTKSQSRIVRDYIRAILNSSDLLQNEIVREAREGFELRNGNRIEILTGDFRTIRGFTLIGAVIDEVCFLGLDADSKVKNDSELINAIKPALATTGGRLICISSPYAKKGWAYRTWKASFGNDAAQRTLVINAPSQALNPTLPDEVIQEAMADDPAAARSEFFGQWRDDVSTFLPRDLIERLVVPGRDDLMPNRRTQYVAFADISGGRGDDAAVAIAHKEQGKTVIDLIRRWRPPFSPQVVVGEIADVLRLYGIRIVTGDNYSAEFVASAFRANRINYQKATKNKSALYLELLPRICSGEIELLDHAPTIDQLANLERRTRTGGKDSVDHPPGSHDDLANVVAGVVVGVVTPKVKIGVVASDEAEGDELSLDEMLWRRRGWVRLAMQHANDPF